MQSLSSGMCVMWILAGASMVIFIMTGLPITLTHFREGGANVTGAWTMITLMNSTR